MTCHSITNGKRAVISLALLCAFIISNASLPEVASARETVYARDYTYNAGDADSKLSSRAIAMDQVKRLLLEELGTYIKSETVLRNAQMSIDEVTMLTAGVVSTNIIDEKWNGYTYYIKVEIVADPDKIAESIKELVAEKDSLDDLKESKAQADAALAEVNRLRAELEATKAALASARAEGKEDTKTAEKAAVLQKQYLDETQKMTANDLWRQGNMLFKRAKYVKALKYFNQALEIKPRMVRALKNRGKIYLKTRKYKKALADIDTAIDIKPNKRGLYFLRFKAYKNLGMKKKAKADLKKAAGLGHKKAKMKLLKTRKRVL
jgi:tetratricopeptide (TPR) repeat protein